MKNLKKDVKVIYNPFAGKKRNFGKLTTETTLEELQFLFDKYQIEANFFPTRYKNHAKTLAQDAKRERYKIVIAAGGDGTISEAANGLINSNLTLGIIPLGTFMNIPRMLSIPNDIEKAIMLIKIGRTRKIDMGCITKLDGKVLNPPHYFLETAGVGIDAQIQEYFLEFEHGKLRRFFDIIQTLFNFYARRVILMIDNKKIPVMRATMVTIANGPYTGTNLKLSPQALLNDHKLSIALYKMKRFDFIKYLLRLFFKEKHDKRKIKLFKGKKIEVETYNPYPVHADATLFGNTPAEFKIIPNALQVITGFPDEDKMFLKKRTPLDP